MKRNSWLILRTALGLWLATAVTTPARAGIIGTIFGQDTEDQVGQLGGQLSDTYKQSPLGQKLQEIQATTKTDLSDLAQKGQQLLDHPSAENAAAVLESLEAAGEDISNMPDELYQAVLDSLPGTQTNREQVMDSIRHGWTHVVFSEEIGEVEYSKVLAAVPVGPEAVAAVVSAELERYMLTNVKKMAKEIAKQLQKDAQEDLNKLEARLEEQLRQQLSKLPQQIIDGRVQLDPIRLPGIRVPVKADIGVATINNWVGFPDKDKPHVPKPNSFMFYVRWLVSELGSVTINPSELLDADGTRIPLQTRRWLKIENASRERLRLWIQYRTLTTREQWQWFPADPNRSHEAVYFEFAPGEVAYLRDNAFKINASRVRFWAETESGQIWSQYRDQDLWLVDEVNGQRGYYAAQMQTFTYRFVVPDEPILWADRAVRVTNHTRFPLRVQAKTLTFDWDEGTGWQTSTPVQLAPGQTATLRQRDGWLLHGSSVEIWGEDAQGQHFRWNRYQETPLRQVGRSGYKSIQIGIARYLLEPPPKPGTEVPTEVARRDWTRHLPADQVRVPSVKSKTVKEARTILEEVGLRATFDKTATPQAIVIGQAPVDQWVPAGSAVKLTVQSSILLVVVPDVIGKTAEEAEQLIKAPGLVIAAQVKGEGGLTTVAASQFAQKLKGFRVVRQDPTHLDEQRQPRKIEKGKTVTCLFEPARPDLVVVPDVRKKNALAAEKLLKEAGLKMAAQLGGETGLTAVPANLYATRLKGLEVVRQDPTPLDTQEKPRRVPKETVVTCFFEPPAPDLVAVPDLLEKTAEEAETLLQGAGLKLLAQVKGEAGVQTVAAGQLTQRLRGYKVAQQQPAHLDAQKKPRRVPRGTSVTCLFERPTVTPDLVTVPNVLGKSAQEAEKLIKEAGLKLTAEILVDGTLHPVSAEQMAQRLKGAKVVHQDPAPVDEQRRPLRVRKGSTITCHFEPALVAVPDVVKKKADEAERVLREAGLRMVPHYQGPAGQVPQRLEDYRVVRQDPPALDAQKSSHRLPRGSAVICFCERELPPSLLVEVPSVVGQTAEAAEKLLQTAGLRMVAQVRGEGGLTTVPASQFGQRLKGAKVVRQDPTHLDEQRRPRKLEKGKTVTCRFEVSKPDLTITVPRLTDKTLTAATREAGQLGLVVRQQPTTVTTRKTKDPALAGQTVIETQSPAAGTKVAKGAVIEVRLVRYEKAAETVTEVVVPRLTGKTLEAAMKEASRVGLIVRQQPGTVATSKTTDAALVGQTVVQGQSEPEGKKVAKGKVIEVRLVRYEKATEAATTVTVPGLLGLSMEAAGQKAGQSGFKVRPQAGGTTTTKVTHDPSQVGLLVVDGQEPAEGARAARGSLIQVRLVRLVRANPPAGGGGVNPAHPNPTQTTQSPSGKFKQNKPVPPKLGSREVGASD